MSFPPPSLPVVIREGEEGSRTTDPGGRRVELARILKGFKQIIRVVSSESEGGSNFIRHPRRFLVSFSVNIIGVPEQKKLREVHSCWSYTK